MIVSVRDNRIDEKPCKSKPPLLDVADARESTLDCRECPVDAPLRDDDADATGNLAFNGRLRNCEYELFMILGILFYLLLLLLEWCFESQCFGYV